MLDKSIKGNKHGYCTFCYLANNGRYYEMSQAKYEELNSPF